MRLLAAAAIAVASAAATPAAMAQERETREVQIIRQGPLGVEGTVLSVSAEGKATARPDMATVMLGVTTEGQTAQAAFQANAQRMNALIQALRRAGVAERDIQTSNISINPQYVYEERQPPRLTGYQATNTVNAKVRNLDRLGATLDAAVNAGGNTLNGVSFSHQQPDAQLDAARTDAMREARRRAELYARAAGLSVGRIISISESGGIQPPVPMPYARMQAADAVMNTPTMPGEIDTLINLSVVFELR